MLSHLLFFNVLSALVHCEKCYSNWRDNEIMASQEKRNWNLCKWEKKGFLATVHNSFHSFWVISTEQLCLLSIIWENRFYFCIANSENRCFFRFYFLSFELKAKTLHPSFKCCSEDKGQVLYLHMKMITIISLRIPFKKLTFQCPPYLLCSPSLLLDILVSFPFTGYEYKSTALVQMAAQCTHYH